MLAMLHNEKEQRHIPLMQGNLIEGLFIDSWTDSAGYLTEMLAEGAQSWQVIMNDILPFVMKCWSLNQEVSISTTNNGRIL